MPPKSILKKTSTPNPQSPAPATPAPVTQGAKDAQHERNLQIALHHANLIQQQKDVEAAILDATVTLLDYPPPLPFSPSTPPDPAHPSAASAKAFTTLVALFQPHDYDALMQERKIADKCGYALCPRAPSKSSDKAKFRWLDDKQGGLKVVPKEQVELWCSVECARRALYVKVQLLEEPGWLRRGNEGLRIELLREGEGSASTVGTTGRQAANDRGQSDAAQMSLPFRLKKNTEGDHISKAMKDLALERGEKETSFNAKELVSDTIREKRAIKTPVAPNLENVTHTAIEGYKPKPIAFKKDEKVDADRDEEDKDWNI